MNKIDWCEIAYNIPQQVAYPPNTRWNWVFIGAMLSCVAFWSLIGWLVGGLFI